MSKKTTLEKHIKEMRGRVARLREVKTPTAKSVGLARLIESEIDKTESVINARSITTKLQDMAEDVVGLQGKQLFQMLEKMKEAYGPEFTDQFKGAAQQALNTLMEQIQAAKDTIDKEILRMEKIINGEPANDIGMGGDDMGADMGPDADVDSDADMGAPGQGDIGGDLPTDDVSDEEPSPEVGDNIDAALSDIGAPDSGSAAGRARKESFLSDKKVLEAFRKAVSEGNRGSKAAQIVAENFGIDPEDVRDIVKEAAKA